MLILRPYITEANLDRVEIYRGVAGGWHADIVLRTVPLGIADSLGTPAAAPIATYEDAEAFALNLVKGCLTIAAANAPEPTAPAPFAILLLYGHVIPVPLAVLAAWSADPMLDAEPMSKAAAHAHLERIVTTYLPNGFSLEAVSALPLSVRQDIELVIVEALIAGVVRHPPNLPAGPGPLPGYLIN